MTETVGYNYEKNFEGHREKLKKMAEEGVKKTAEILEQNPYIKYEKLVNLVGRDRSTVRKYINVLIERNHAAAVKRQQAFLDIRRPAC